MQVSFQNQKRRFDNENRLSVKNTVQGIALCRYFSPKVSEVPGYMLLALFGTEEVNALTIATANDFKKFNLFILCSAWKHNLRVVR